jgi:two-component system, NarL family, sensor histidine kinase UhpB
MNAEPAANEQGNPPAATTSQELFRGLLESAPDAIVIVDDRGAIRIVNAEAESMFGFERSELIGQPVEMLVPDDRREAHVANRRGYTAAPRRRPMGIGMDLVGERKDGSRFPVEISLSPLQTEEGLLITSVIRDISERKRAESALRESERRFRDFIEGTDDLVVRLDGEGRFIYVNRTSERILGLSPVECAGLSAFDFVHPDDRAATEEAFAGWAAEPVQGTTFENRQLSRDGGVTRILWTVNPRYDESGRMTTVTAIGRDITARERLEAAERGAIEARAELKAERVERELGREVLRRSIAAQEEERRRIARGLHDETAQALTGILLGLGRIEAASELPDAREEAARLGGEVSGALRELRRIAMSLRPTALDDLGLVPALEQLTEHAPAAERSAVRFEHAGLERRLDPSVETAAYRVVQEALTNAARHAEATAISVEVRQQDGVLSAIVEDDGRGFQGDPPGLGLTGMRERAELIGGALEIASSPGAGTKVTLSVPLGEP